MSGPPLSGAYPTPAGQTEPGTEGVTRAEQGR